MTRNPHAAELFTDDDEVIEASLQDVSVPALLCSLVHMTGDPAWVRGEIRPRVAISLDIQSGIPDEMKERRFAAWPCRRSAPTATTVASRRSCRASCCRR